jgi:hypothetical protein
VGNGNSLTTKREHSGRGVSPGQSVSQSVLRCAFLTSKRNAELVGKMAKIIRSLDFEVAALEETR